MKENCDNYGIQIIKAYKKYGEQKVFENLNIGFIENKITAVLAPSGYGKTTLLNIISGIESLDRGEVILKNKSISYIFQEDRLIPWLTVYENIAFVLKSIMNKEDIHKIINKYLDLVKLKEYKNKLPDQLSGGMKRRVALARAFSYKSHILLMDEPFKGLDFNLKKEIIEDFLKVWKEDKRTVILVTHDMEEAKLLAQEIYFLDEYNREITT